MMKLMRLALVILAGFFLLASPLAPAMAKTTCACAQCPITETGKCPMATTCCCKNKTRSEQTRNGGKTTNFNQIKSVPAFSGRNIGAKQFSSSEKAESTPQDAIITASSAKPLEANKKARVSFQLTDQRSGQPLLPEQLEKNRGALIHAYLVDASMKDFQHVHPNASKLAGTYSFSFMPKTTNSYRLWLEYRRAGETANRVSFADINNAAPTANDASTLLSLEQKEGGLIYRLNFQQPPKPDASVAGNIHVLPEKSKGSVAAPRSAPLRSIDGKMPVITVLFEDYQTLIPTAVTMAPKTIVAPKKDVAAPIYDFSFTPPRRGLYRIFLERQDQRKGSVVSFAIMVPPAGR